MSSPNKAAQALGALGGKARAKTLSKARKREIARLGGIARATKHSNALQTPPGSKKGHSGKGSWPKLSYTTGIGPFRSGKNVEGRGRAHKGLPEA